VALPSDRAWILGCEHSDICGRLALPTAPSPALPATALPCPATTLRAPSHLCPAPPLPAHHYCRPFTAPRLRFISLVARSVSLLGWTFIRWFFAFLGVRTMQVNATGDWRRLCCYRKHFLRHLNHRTWWHCSAFDPPTTSGSFLLLFKQQSAYAAFCRTCLLLLREDGLVGSAGQGGGTAAFARRVLATGIWTQRLYGRSMRFCALLLYSAMQFCAVALHMPSAGVPGYHLGLPLPLLSLFLVLRNAFCLPCCITRLPPAFYALAAALPSLILAQDLDVGTCSNFLLPSDRVQCLVCLVSYPLVGIFLPRLTVFHVCCWLGRRLDVARSTRFGRAIHSLFLA